MADLDGRVIAIAGAGGGLGPLVAKRFAEGGASLSLADRSQEMEKFGRVDGLLHLVGGYRGGDPIHSFDLADYEFLHDLLVRTLQHTTRAFYSALAGSEHGRVVLVSSAAAQNPENTNAAYAAAKAAAEAWTLALADAFTGSRATANIVVVNAIETPRMREESPETERPTFTPAEHLADAIAFLCSDSAARMNGQRLSLHP
jgi:NAD(P)-dependent dehydrogenase (short-subunit alcohol dehydrogenase family)